MRTALGIFGVVLAAGCLLIIAGMIANIAAGDDNVAGNVIGLIVMLAAAGGGVALVWANLLKRPHAPGRSPAEIERQVLAVASRSGGQVTVAEVALHCRLTIEESKRLLSRMNAQGVAAVSLSDDGDMLYTFAGLEPPPSRRSR
jgi:hypothetical protein